MTCPQCGQDNALEMRFCGACGSELSARRPSCKFDNPPAFRFCGRCGTSLSLDVGDSGPTSDTSAAISAGGQPEQSSP